MVYGERVRVAVLSDVHGNLAALERVLDDCADADAVWCLGDIVGYGPRPNEVIDALRRRGAVAVAGNHDRAALGLLDISDFNTDAAQAMVWTSGVLTAKSREYLASLENVRVEREHTLAHGSPRDPLWEYVTTPTQASANLNHFATRLCLIGHTHIASAFIDRGDGVFLATYAPPGFTVDLSQLSAKALLNPGSVGQPRDGNPQASYLLLDLAAGIATWRRVRYPIRETQAQMREAHLPRRLIDRLSLGR